MTACDQELCPNWGWPQLPVPVVWHRQVRRRQKRAAMSDIVDRANAALEGITPGPWKHCTAPSADSDETHAEYLAGSLIALAATLLAAARVAEAVPGE